MILECGGLLCFSQKLPFQKIINFVDSLGNMIISSSVFRILKQSN